MGKMHLKLFFLLIVFISFCVSSCHNGISDNEATFDKVVGYKWSRNPYKGPHGITLAIAINPHVDYLAYYAFNADSTVDYFRGEYCMTGAFNVDGEFITCMFVKPVDEDDTIISNDGAFNSKTVLRYKDNKLYLYDYLYRTKNNEWVSDFDQELRELFYGNAGQYKNNKYNANFYGYRDDYDTTVDAMTVVERYNWREETYYRNGVRHGIYKRYESGKLSVFGAYSNGVPTGDWYYFHPTGELYRTLPCNKMIDLY